MEYHLTHIALRELSKLPPEVQKRIFKKLDFYTQQINPLAFADRLTHQAEGQFRFRVGDYRVIFDIEVNKLVVLAVGHRRDIYKKII